MGKARLNAILGAGVWSAVALSGVDAGAAAGGAGPSRFASYGTEADCVAAGAFAPAACHVAFANARTEYEAKTPSFPSQALCARRYASCMAWPGADGASFRPAWDGVDIVDTPVEHSVTPSPGATGRTVRFAARSLEEMSVPLVIRRAAVPVPPRRAGEATARVDGHTGRPSSVSSFVQDIGAPEKASAPSAPPPAGSGFKLEDGVLTYPAPARFQPKNLPKD